MNTIMEVLRKQKDYCVIHGNCLEVMREIPARTIDMVLCDLPYGTTKCKWDVIIPFPQLWSAYDHVCYSATPILLFGMEPFSSLLRSSNLMMYKYDWYWDKIKPTNFLHMNNQPGKIVEVMSIFYENKPTYNPQKIMNPKGIEKRGFSSAPRGVVSKNAIDITDSNNSQITGITNGNYEPDKLLPKNIIEIEDENVDELEGLRLQFSKDMKGRLHPTQKPVKLLEYLIKTYTNEGDVILDNTCGSGSTGVAALNLNRRFIGIEKDENYYNIACKRLEKLK